MAIDIYAYLAERASDGHGPRRLSPEGVVAAALRQRLRKATAELPPCIFATLSGAHLYGFPDTESDYDIRAVHVAPIHEVVGLRQPKETIERMPEGTDTDLVSHEIGKFCRLLCKPNGNCLEQLYSPLLIITTPEHRQLKELAQDVLCRNIWKHYLGFWNQQRQRYSEKPWKRLRQLLYGYRVLLTGIRIMRGRAVEANLVDMNLRDMGSDTIARLIEMKIAGETDVPARLGSQASYEQNQLAERLKEAAMESTLPEKPRTDRINEWLVKLRLNMAKDVVDWKFVPKPPLGSLRKLDEMAADAARESRGEGHNDGGYGG